MAGPAVSPLTNEVAARIPKPKDPAPHLLASEWGSEGSGAGVLRGFAGSRTDPPVAPPNGSRVLSRDPVTHRVYHSRGSPPFSHLIVLRIPAPP
jgi:hypothetical protein